LKYGIRFSKQWRSKEASGAYSPERRPWGRINALCSHLDQNMLRNDVFVIFDKTYSIAYSSGAYKPWRINTHCSHLKTQF